MSPQSNPSQSSWRFGQIHQIEFPIVVVRKPQYFGVVDGVSVLVTKILRPKKSWPEGWSTGARLAVRSAPVPARRSPEGRVPLRHQQAPCWSPVVFLVNRRAAGGASVHPKRQQPPPKGRPLRWKRSICQVRLRRHSPRVFGVNPRSRSMPSP